MSDSESPEGGPDRKKLAKRHTPEERRSHGISQPRVPDVPEVPYAPHLLDFNELEAGGNLLGLDEAELNPFDDLLPQTPADTLMQDIEEAFQKDINYGKQTAGPSGVSLQQQSNVLQPQSNPLPPGIVEYYALRNHQIQGINENDMKILYFHDPQYLIDRTIGSGAFGSVHRAQRFIGQNPSNIAIKILKQGVGNANNYTMPLEREIIELLMPNPHENVVSFNEVFYRMESNADIRALYIVSELSTVGDVYHTVQTVNPQGVSVWVPIKEGLARHLIKGIANGLRHMKTLNLCHGDLKLENILLFDRPAMFPINDELDRTRIDRWTPKLTDFGNSKLRQQTDPPGQILVNFPLCTIHYASPESWARNPDGTHYIYDAYSADVYSVGVCLLSLLIGGNPFKPPFMQYPWANDPDYELKLRRYAKYCGAIKENSNYLKLLCKLFSHPLRQFLFKSLNPNPGQRITIEQLLTDPWISTPKSLESENVSSRAVLGYTGIFASLKTATRKDSVQEF